MIFRFSVKKQLGGCLACARQPFVYIVFEIEIHIYQR